MRGKRDRQSVLVLFTFSMSPPALPLYSPLSHLRPSDVWHSDSPDLTDEEKEIINSVIARAEKMEAMEQERIG